MPPTLTAAELVRSKKKTSKQTIVKKQPSSSDLDDEIRRLEAELEASSSSSSSSEDEDGNNIDKGEDSQEPLILSLSTVKDDRIQQLPQQLLPSNAKRTLKIDRNSADSNSHKSKKPRASKPVAAGLEAAVQEVLNGYVPRSAEKIPFYCRYCAKQMSDETEWKEHHTTEFHKTAVAVERKRTYCRLCRKQLTSIVQMEEHLKSRPHKHQLDRVKSKQRGQQQGRGGRGNSRRCWK